MACLGVADALVGHSHGAMGGGGATHSKRWLNKKELTGMKDFVFRNDTELLFRNDIREMIARIAGGHKVMFVYGSGSVFKNGCHEDVTTALKEAGVEYMEFDGSSREFERISDGIRLAKKSGVDMVIGAGGASVMDSAKLIAFGVYHEADLWDYLRGKSPAGLERLKIALIPTYPSSGSENGLGAVAVDSRTGDFGTAYGIPADYAILCPKYSLSLDKSLTAYTGLVTIVQLTASILGDRNPMSYDAGISYVRNVWKATQKLMVEPSDLDARGIILIGAAMSTSSRLGLGKESNYAYDIYELEFLPEQLFGAQYRESLTAIFPRFMRAVARRHAEDVQKYLSDAFGLNGTVEESCKWLIEQFSEMGAEMYFKGDVSDESILSIPCESELSQEEVLALTRSLMKC